MVTQKSPVKSERTPKQYRVAIQKKLDELDDLSPSQIEKLLAGHMRGIKQPNEHLANWLCEQLRLNKVTVKTFQNVALNIEVTIEVPDCNLVFRFFVKTSAQDYLGIKKPGDLITGLSMTKDQAILIRGYVDRHQGDVGKFAARMLAEGMMQSTELRDFVKFVRKNPEVHPAMQAAGLYPADILAAFDNIEKKLQEEKSP